MPAAHWGILQRPQRYKKNLGRTKLGGKSELGRSWVGEVSQIFTKAAENDNFRRKTFMFFYDLLTLRNARGVYKRAKTCLR